MNKEEIKKQREKDIFENNKYESKYCFHCIYFDAFNLGNYFPCTACDPCGEHKFFESRIVNKKDKRSRKSN